ncbi:MAG: TM2 domain-containing protein [Treponema sp.]|jgi:TM2 domain-containing membrane protein YozV|nr:TM2 domain-containing protein [Treponema sp.]
MYSVGIAYLLWLISGCGALGLHRFYLGKIPSGLLWMFTGGLCMVGSIYDFFTLGGQVRKANMERALLDGYRNGAPLDAYEAGRRLGSRFVNDRHRDAAYAGGFVDGIFGAKSSPNGSRRADSIEQAILKVAKQNHGILSPSDVALYAGVSLDQAKKELDGMISKGHVEMRVKKSGGIAYIIPDMLDVDEGFEEL